MRNGAPEGSRRVGPMAVARAVYLVAAVGFGWWGLRTHGDQIAQALGDASVPRVLLGWLLVIVGLALTGGVWRSLMGAYGHDLPRRPAAATFFIGQLGKYIPGSVWSLGAQADMARRFAVPPRTTVAVGLLFLWTHVATAVPVATLVADDSTSWLASPWIRGLALLVAVIGLTPAVLVRLGGLMAGADEPLRLGWAGVGRLLATMAGVWAAYGAATVLVVPPGALAATGGSLSVLVPVTAAFAASYVIGVLVILAPAGVGAREVALVSLLAPALGVPAAAATALLIRAVHTIADFAIAGLAWSAARGARTVTGMPSQPVS